MKPTYTLTAVLCLSMTVASADIATSSEIASLEAGIVCAPDPIGSVPAPGTVAGTTHIIAEEPDFVSTTRQVPAVLGVGFGVKAQAVATGGLDGINMVLTHPKMGATNATMQTFATRISGSDPSLTFYQFDYSYELVLGTWEFTAMSGDQALYSVSFEVVDPRAVPQLANACGYLELLS
ncbi:DUF3859 domain-containing protein [Yoonia sp. F2084L]|uniref:DUF3859 domain-containing protein n=1 Tax=Yoonia sp. F2084L TaxID=2926419 RepID=UPI001FF6977E|nr:DUF3859 domain-containing protein [Yoonia sp. F2084L]MCK0096876.1 DUF3859 domain-containing protein [Yoonia sp. F2084L]